ncbi:Bug family tripartite tricarboxylate transporter substrate binding protein [Cupriavidus sp. CP313]
METHAIGPQVYRKVAYDAMRQFDPVGNIGAFPYALVIRPGLPAKSVEAFVAYAKRPDAKLTYGSWGVGSSSQVTMEMVKSVAQIDMMHVPFTGAAPALAALAGGQIDALMIPVSVAASYHESGKARILAVAAPERLSEMPRIPTLRERGLNVVGGTWLVVAAPSGMAPVLANRLNAETERVVRDPRFLEAMQRLSVVPGGGSMDDVRRMMAAEYRRWGDAIRKADIRLD